MNPGQISHYAMNCPAMSPLARLASLEIEKTLFVVVSLLDLLLTSLLLRTGFFFETNPVASFFLGSWGLLGMSGYKLVAVGMILGVINVIALWRLTTARWLLVFGSVFTGGVVIYSLSLLLSYYGFLI